MRLGYILAGAIALYFIGWASVVFAAPPPELAKMQEQMLGVSAQLNGNCSSTLIHSKRDEESGKVQTLFLTAKHCVEDVDEKDMSIDLPVYQNNRIVKKDRYIARVKAQYFKADLALIELKDTETFFKVKAKIGAVDAELFMGEPTWTVGYPEGRALTITTGLLGSLETLDFPKDGVEYFRATSSFAPGNSGGAVYRKNAAGDYELLGVTVVRSSRENFIGYYVPLEQIHDFLKVSAPEAIGIEPKAKVGASN
jgi:S1-C subfamily serine protease